MTSDWTGEGDTCGGDSGSGLVRVSGDTSQLLGVVSYGVGCDSSVNGQYIRNKLSFTLVPSSSSFFVHANPS